MKIVRALVLGISLIIFSSTTLKINAQTANLTINITSISEPSGVIQVGLYNTSSAFPKVDKELIALRIDADSSTVTYTFADLPYGDYAIAFYHDVNSDGKCNRNWIGIPTEDYGFSNDVRVRFSAPSFEITKFSHTEDQEIFMTMKN